MIAERAARIRLVIADDHRLVLAGLKALIEADPELHIVGEAVDGRAAVALVAHLKPDVLVLDLSLPELSGAQVAQRLRTDCPDCRVLVLTVHEDRAYLRQLLEAGVAGYILKRSAPEELLHAIHVVVAGGIYLDPAVAGLVVGARDQRTSKSDPSAPARLSERELSVLRLVVEGYSNKEVSAQLAIGLKTVETYKARAMEKLGFETRVELVRYAVNRGWLNGQ